jgi:hypothetical protein
MFKTKHLPLPTKQLRTTTTTTMSIKETKKQMAKALKAAGYNSRRVSIRTSRSGGALDVTIRCEDADPQEIKEIAENFKVVHRCQASGDILSGGNTFVFVRWDDDLIERLGRESIYKILVTPNTLAEATDYQGVTIGPLTFFRQHSDAWFAEVEDTRARVHVSVNWRTKEISDAGLGRLEVERRAYNSRQEKAIS